MKETINRDFQYALILEPIIEDKKYMHAAFNETKAVAKVD